MTLKFQHRDGFVNEHASNVSLGGMFINAWVPEPQGSVFLFEVQVADRQRLIHGIGEVVWAREAEESPERPSGMGIRFLKLDDASRAVINGMVEDQVRRNGTRLDTADQSDGTVEVDDLFTSESSPAGVASSAATADEGPEEQRVSDVEAGRGRAMARRGGRGIWAVWLTLIALLGCSALIVLFT